jgi:mannose-6-phosphate isomerase-like protein (cupin superfamily)
MDDLSFNTKRGDHFTSIELGSMATLDQYVFQLPSTSLSIEGKVFLNQLLGLTGSEISVNKMPPGQGMPFYHKHRLNEEVFLFLSGTGEFQIDGVVFPIQEGSVVRVARDGERCWRNNGVSDLVYIVIQAREGSYEGHSTQDGIGVSRPVSWNNSDGQSN